MKRAALFLLILVLFVSASAVALYYWGYRTFHSPGNSEQAVRMVVPRGANLNRIAELLQEASAINMPRVFVLAARLSGEGRAIKAGEYEFAAGDSQRTILTTLTLGRTVQRHITVPEGLSVAEVLALLNNTTALNGTASLPSEGSLLPETYRFELGDNRNVIIRRMTKSMNDTVNSLWSKRAKGLPLDSPEQAVILASIVEKETGIPEERARVAAVFLNRIRKGMRLQSDPTVVYGITRGHRSLGRAISRKDLATDTPYNTYRISGLPPGPICNPGRDAIAAVLNPIQTDELYFVADGTGGHAFAKTLAEHNRNVVRWRRLQRSKKP